MDGCTCGYEVFIPVSNDANSILKNRTRNAKVIAENKVAPFFRTRGNNNNNNSSSSSSSNSNSNSNNNNRIGDLTPCAWPTR